MFVIAVGTAMLAACTSDDNNGPQKSVIAVIGDVPYGTTPTDETQTIKHAAFIAAINADRDISLVMHVGDIHSGSQYCTQTYDQSIFQQWTAFRIPLVYVPGDNEWSDCHKAKQGGGTYNPATGQIDYVVDGSGNKVSYAGGDPMANLELVRTMFFPTPGKTLGAASDIHTQAVEYDRAFPADAKFVEHVWWKQSGVLFVTLNVPGGSNNDTDPWYKVPSMSAAQSQEVAERSAATLRWLDTAFVQAAKDGAIAIVIQLQADMWDLDGATAAHLTQYRQFVDSIASKTLAFGKPVLLFVGDSHVYRTDNPLVAGAPCLIEPAPGAAAVTCTVTNMPAGSNNPPDPYTNQPWSYNVPNFRRIVVHGSTLPLEYLRLTIDPTVNAAGSANAFGPFSWARVQPSI